MTREKAINKIKMFSEYDVCVDKYDTLDIINEIYDGFESRICKNCKYFKRNEMIANCSNLEVGAMNDASFISVSENFGCKLFEKREDERD